MRGVVPAELLVDEGACVHASPTIPNLNQGSQQLYNMGLDQYQGSLAKIMLQLVILLSKTSFSLKPLGNQVLLSCQRSLMAYLDLDIKKFQLEMQFLFGITWLVRVWSKSLYFPSGLIDMQRKEKEVRLCFEGLIQITSKASALTDVQPLQILELLWLLVQWTRFLRADFPIHDGGESCPSSAPAFPPASSSGGTLCIGADIFRSNTVLIFTDAAFSAVRCTYAFILVDATGNFIYARAGRSSASSILQAELLAILEGLLFITRNCYTSVQLFTDSMLAVTYLNSDSSNWPWDTAYTLHRCLICWRHDYTTIKHTPRQFNMLAHTLAQSVDLSIPATEFIDIPACLVDYF